MSVKIVTDDGYMKDIPYQSGMIDWTIGMEVEIYHSEEGWTATYDIVDKNFLPTDGSVGISYRFDLVRKGKKVHEPNFIRPSISDKWARDLADEIDADILNQMMKILGMPTDALDKKVKP